MSVRWYVCELMRGEIDTCDPFHIRIVIRENKDAFAIFRELWIVIDLGLIFFGREKCLVSSGHVDNPKRACRIG